MKVEPQVKCVLIIFAAFALIECSEAVFGNYGFGSFYPQPRGPPVAPGPMYPYYNPQAGFPPGPWRGNKDAEWLPPHHSTAHRNPYYNHPHDEDDSSFYDDDDEEDDKSQFDNKSCPGGWSGGTRWPCIPTKNCTTLKPRGIRTHCGWSAGSPLVCCPVVNAAIQADVRVPPRNNIRPPVQVKPQVQKCGQLVSDSRGAIVFRDDAPASIVGGVPLRTAQSSPWMAAIGERVKNEIEWFCGGSLISAQWVITAAHCTTRKTEIVRLGELDFSRTDEPAAPKDFIVVKVEKHPDYSPPNYYHDVALLKLREPVTFNQYIQPVCLPPPIMKNLEGAIATVSGWGDTAWGEDRSNVLLEVGVPIIPNSQCTKYFASRTIAKLNYPQGITNNLLCAGDTEEGGKDACKGDSGGPLVMREGNVHNLIGIVSTGVGCGSKNFPGVYVRISNYTEWIKNVIR
ncbi:clotting factor G beta subunit-like [Cloeon dipterum]|uniref:clotting factor G beta subunit-like n=1 Tax=Cloeon dipterum TaxID=197152 RepID=UPI0032204422